MVKVQSSEVDASALLISGLGLFSIVGIPWSHPSLTDVTMGTKACNLPKAVKLNKIR
jgi:hypothetical protein